jgi:hypothetical protein
MRGHEYHLGNGVMKTKDSLILHKSEKAAVEIEKETLAIPIEEGSRNVGYIFHGQGKMLVDAIVETEKGAVGRSITQKLDAPFLMLGDVEAISKQLVAVGPEDSADRRISEREFRDKAERLLDRFFQGQHHGGIEHEGIIFASLDSDERLDVLLLEGSRIIYKSKNVSFVSTADKSILEDAGTVVVSRAGRSVFVGKSPTFHCCH